MIQAEMFAH